MEVIIKNQTSSTNEDIKKMNSPAEWTTVVAFCQNFGKGSKGREFVSPVGGAYFSFVFYPDKEILPIITPLAAVATRRVVLDFYGKNCQIKWVNDLFFDGKKVCGILTEGKTFGEKNGVVVGIGVNLYSSEIGYGDYENIVGYLSDGKPDFEKIKNFCIEVVKTVKQLLYTDFMPEYIANSCVVGKDVKLVQNGFAREVTVKGINSDGSLTVVSERGEEKVIFGDVSLRF